METSFPGSLKAEQDANFALFTTYALLPIFPEVSWVQEWTRIRVDGKIRFECARVDVEIFESWQKKLRIQYSGYVWTGP